MRMTTLLLTICNDGSCLKLIKNCRLFNESFLLFLGLVSFDHSFSVKLILY